MLVRGDLGGADQGVDSGEILCRLVHMSDLHVMDTVSPARSEWVELLANETIWKPLIHMHRPYEALTLPALAAHIERLNEPDFNGEIGRPCDLVISTGDNIDNAQRNELDAYLALMTGGVAQFDAHGGVHDHRMHSSPDWPFWLPDTGANAERWRASWPAGQPFIESASEPVTSPGIPGPWTSVIGNHDVLRQGTSLTNAELEVIAVGNHKGFGRSSTVVAVDPLAEFLDFPDRFSAGPGNPIEAYPDRRVIDAPEWVAAHRLHGARGYDLASSGPAPGDTLIDLEHVRIVILDTNHPQGDYQGSTSRFQMDWLEARLAEVASIPGRLAIVASHHGSESLTNTRGNPADRDLAYGPREVISRYGCVVAWLVGHRHINAVVPRPTPTGGYWEITTCSVIDYPSQMRSIDAKMHSDGSIELACTMVDHHALAGSLAALHREIAFTNTPPRARDRMAGSVTDTDVRLLLPAR